MNAFPDTPQFNALNRPMRIEWQACGLEVEGEIPAEIEGAFFRAVPDPAHAPMFEDDIALSGDGMVARFQFEDGAGRPRHPVCRTARYVAEQQGAPRAVRPLSQSRSPTIPRSQGVDRTVANTTPVWHAGRLFMTKEDGRAYEINPHTLETIGPVGLPRRAQVARP